jgi:hypothetical protein
MLTKDEIEKIIKELLVRYMQNMRFFSVRMQEETRQKIPILMCSFLVEKILKSQIYLRLQKNLGK